jgi:hypothetical protein
MHLLHAILGVAAIGADTAPTYPMPPFRPFLDPIELHQWWFLLLVPMAFLVAMSYKAVRLQTLEAYWRHVLLISAQIIVGMIALGAATYLLVFWFARFVAERAA